MKIFKFGGASVKDSSAVKNVLKILNLYKEEPLVLVISAMGKITNHLESILNTSDEEVQETEIKAFIKFHKEISLELEILTLTEPYIDQTEADLRHHLDNITDNFQLYDEVVSKGELLSTFIIQSYISTKSVKSTWVDTREIIKTTNSHKNANIDWANSSEHISHIKDILKLNHIAVCQGFIGSTSDNKTTTLGREGSDFSAAILAYLLDADEVNIWKDVDGMQNADPRYFNDTIKLDEVSYREAIELAYYGASVIHPKTIKPLQNKKIPLYVKSFVNPKKSGTVIKEGLDTKPLVPSYIFKPKQILLSISPKDFSFISESHIQQLFTLFSKEKITINLMQNSALNFSVVIDEDKVDLDLIQSALKQEFYFKFNSELELITIRHFNEEVIKKLTNSKTILLEQRSRNTLRLVVK